jgi:(p)ppGpp synthase/HD superfamily hydrolase
VKDKHNGQVDKSGVPYIWHLIRVARRVKSTDEKILALLHDVVEDTDTSFDEVRKIGASEEIINALRLLTHEKGVDYEEYVKGISKNSLAKTVKLADLADNSNPERLEKLPEDTRNRLISKYKMAFSILSGDGSLSH